MKEFDLFKEILKNLLGMERVTSYKGQNKVSVKLEGIKDLYLFRYTPTKGFGNVRKYPFEKCEPLYFETALEAVDYFIREMREPYHCYR